MDVKLTGKITEIKDTEVISDKFQKRVFVVNEYDPNYPRDYAFEFHKDKCSILDNYKSGDKVTVEANVQCNEYNGRYYTQLKAWRIEKEGKSEAVKAAENILTDDGSELPF